MSAPHASAQARRLAALDASRVAEPPPADGERLALAALAETERSHQMLVEQLAEGVVIADFETGRVTQMNCAARRLTGYALAEVAGLSLRHLAAPGEEPSGPELVRAVREGRSEAGRRRLRHKDGSLIDVEMSVGFLPSAGKTMISLVVRPIAERLAYEQRLFEYQRELEALTEQLRTAATTDGLTGIKNRAAFNERFAEVARRAVRSGRPLALILVDVDQFKKFNDSFGHPAGDDVLVRVAEALRDSVRSTDFAARYGGDEFAAILPDTDLDGAAAVAERVRWAVESLVWSLRQVTVSVGMASSPPSACDPEALLREADAALYRAKRDGRNRVAAAEPKADCTLED
jgi:diguanylate cyclase (GGDEF)-like protein/PAS domain S-box-containing protein